MGTIFIALGALIGYIVAYHTYGRWLARRVFKLNPNAPVPSIELNDDTDYVPTKKAIVFGHHFTSIAGTGPIVGPAIAVMWGWLPALLWVIFGSILIGAVHDFGSLVVSLRNRGQTIGDVAGKVLNRRVRLLFLLVLFMGLTIVLAIFGLVIANVFRSYPAAIFPCVVQIPIAIAIGFWLHRKGMNLFFPSLLALITMYLTVIFGDQNTITGIALFDTLGEYFHAFNITLASWPTIVWVAILLLYSYIASVLPVWTLLQPRDYINSLQLLSALALIVVGLLTAAIFGGAPTNGVRTELAIIAPIIETQPLNAPPIMPFLFITIACGAISGFHCLVSSGTTSKQLSCETDAQLVGYGSMLTEAFLATLVILACVAGLGLGVGAAGAEDFLTGKAAWASRYSDWATVSSAAVGSFVLGAANFVTAIGINQSIAIALMGVLVASFAGTTMDTACRLQRYVIQELASTFAPRISRTALASEAYEFDNNLEHANRYTGEAADHRQHAMNPFVWLTNKHGATIFAVLLACAIAALPGPGQPWSWRTIGSGGLILWPLFGATNQLLGGLAFVVITFWLLRRRMPVLFVLPPMVFMLIMPAWAMLAELPRWWSAERWVLVVIALATLVLEAWMIVEALLMWTRVRRQFEGTPRAAV